MQWGKDSKVFVNLDAGRVLGTLTNSSSQVVDASASDSSTKVVKSPQHSASAKSGNAKAHGPEAKSDDVEAHVPEAKSGNVEAPDPEAEAHEHVESIYGYGSGLPSTSLLDMLPDLDESVSTHGLSADRTSATEMALLKGLAAREPGCRYLQIGSWRGSATANVAEMVQDCVSVSLEGEGSESVFPERTIAERGVYRSEIGSVTYGSHEFEYASFKDYFDLVFVDRCCSRQAVETATKAAFDLLRSSPNAAIVWKNYSPPAEQASWSLLAGVLDGIPEEVQGSLYHVSDTSCMIWWPKGDLSEESPGRSQGIDKKFEIRFTAKEAARKLVVLDDGFPSLRSPFRVAEYNAYLEHWQDASVYSDAMVFRPLGEDRSFGEVLEDYRSMYPELGSRVLRMPADINLDGDLAYCLFLNNTSRFLPLIEKNGAPFAFTLYPGGGFKLYQKDSEKMLSRVCSSPNFRKVIATQKVTRDYLLDQGFCGPEDVEFVYGGVFPSTQLAKHAAPRNEYERNKETFDVCFVAYKYRPESIKSKGYDMFVETAKRFAETHEDIVFHVVGNFDESDLDLSGIGDKIKFHGRLPTESFPAFYANMDIILSPNAPFALQPGSFDGFPTGACIEAGLCGVAVFSADPLDQNVAFEEGEEIVIIPRDAESISETIDYYYNNYDELRWLAERGREAFDRVFDLRTQLEPRLRILSELLGESRLEKR